MPIPKDTPLSTLRARFDRAASAAEKAAEKKGAEADSTVLENVRKQQRDFEGLVSKTPQMDSYRTRFGVDWTDRFTPVSTFSKQAFFSYEGKALVEHLWHRLPNSRFKRFQEMFCEPQDYAIPKPDLSAACVTYPTREDLNRCALTGCLVSPARIPFKLLVDLGIVPAPDRKLTDLEAVAIKSEPGVIQNLKAIFEASQPLAANNLRFSVVHQLRDDAATHYPKAKAAPESVVGTLVYTRENVSIDRSTIKNQRTPWTAPQLIPAFFSNIYAAQRKTDHQSSGYELKTTTMGNLTLEWNELTARAVSPEGWRLDAPPEVKQKIREDLVRLVARSREELSAVTHHLNQQAAEKFEQLEARLADGSNNITTAITAASAAVNRLEKQLRTVPYKSGHNTVDSEQISRLIKAGEHAFSLIQRSLVGAGSSLRDEIQRRDGFFNQRGLSDDGRVAQAKVILSRMAIPATALNQVPPIRPFRAFEIAHRTAIEQLRTAIYAQNAQRASAAMVKLVIYSKLQQANAIFELLRALTSRSETVPLAELRRHANALRGLLEARSVFPYTSAPQFQKIHLKLQQTVKKLVSGLEEYDRRGLDLDERRLMYSRLRAYLDKTDLEACTNELVALDEDDK